MHDVASGQMVVTDMLMQCSAWRDSDGWVSGRSLLDLRPCQSR
jgi:hypothetical protein